jgi:hypothetical protein
MEQVLAILKPQRLPWSNLEITSKPPTKRKGERGSSCLRPQKGKNNPNGQPLSKTENEEGIEIWIQLIQAGRKPSLFRKDNYKLHSILLKPFFLSILIAIRPPFLFWT